MKVIMNSYEISDSIIDNDLNIDDLISILTVCASELKLKLGSYYSFTTDEDTESLACINNNIDSLSKNLREISTLWKVRKGGAC